jgi:hypothetical protein
VIASRATGACASIALHAALLVAMVIAPEPPKAEPIAANAVPQEQNDELDMRLLPSSADGTGLACEGRYTGIGLVTYRDIIYDVVPGGPADRAGVRNGDIFMNGEMFQRDEHPVGKRLPLTVERDGKRLDLFVVIGSICFEKSSGEGSTSIPHLREGRP